MGLEFDGFTLDTERFQLIRSGEVVAVEPKVFDFILFMARSGGRVVTKDELIEGLWGGRIVSETAVSSCVKAARKALGDDGRTQSVIKTVHGRGFRFALEPSEPATPVVESPVTPAGTIDMPFVQPSLVVLPADVPGDAPGLGFVGKQVTDTLRTALGRMPFMTILSRKAVETLRSASLQDLKAHAGEGYLFDLTLGLDGDKVVGLAELTSIGSGALIWSRKVDVSADQAAPALINEILPRLEPALAQSIYERMKNDPASSDARPLILQALSVTSIKGWHGESFAEAEGLLRKAIAIDPDLPLGRALLALIVALGQRVGFSEADDDSRRAALHEAETAMGMDPMDSTVLGLAGCAMADAGEPERAIPILRRAIELNPDNAHAHAALGAALASVRSYDEGIVALQHGIAISPFDNRLPVWQSMLALTQLINGDPDTALETAKGAVAYDDRTYMSRMVLTGVHLARGEEDQAIAALGETRRVNKGLSPGQVVPILGKKLGSAFVDLMDKVPA